MAWRRCKRLMMMATAALLSGSTFLLLFLPLFLVLLATETLVVVPLACEKLLEMVDAVYHSFIHAERFWPASCGEKP